MPQVSVFDLPMGGSVIPTAVLPENDVRQLIESMRTRTTIVASVDGA